ncbi:hypothetical protein DKX38_021313 [Salix brachista]|uniref:Glutaredoxin domain-containing protein n=1 Tax=Salix brachista TaxID=2182728 RepID=A0A5N5K902_9ROSI|nr:hypothetical protein DKX38_021313 [Salix brachista]
MDVVNSMIQEKPVVIFSKSSCCMSHSIESLMRGFGANPTIYQLDQIPNGQQIERELVVMGFRQSVPAVFIGQQLIGNERQDKMVTGTAQNLVQSQLVPLLKLFCIEDNKFWEDLNRSQSAFHIPPLDDSTKLTLFLKNFNQLYASSDLSYTVAARVYTCCMSHSIESLIRGFGANPTVYQLEQLPNGEQIERALVQLGFRQSLPAVFIGQQLIAENDKRNRSEPLYALSYPDRITFFSGKLLSSSTHLCYAVLDKDVLLLFLSKVLQCVEIENDVVGSTGYLLLRLASTYERLRRFCYVTMLFRSSCCMSHSIESLLRGFGANPTVYEIDRMPNGQQVERALMQLGFRQSLPAVFIGQQLVGNERKVISLHVQNQLVPLLIQAGAIWI